MSLREMDQFNEIINKIKDIINSYDNYHIERNKIRVFLASGDSFNYAVPRDSIAHLLGIKVDFLSTCGHFKSKSSYALLKELCQNQVRISGMIKDGRITLNNIFSKHVKEKIDSFIKNTSISIYDTTFVCKYKKEKAHYQGNLARNCDYIIFKIEDDGTFLELDLKITDKIVVPVSNRMFSDENEAADSLKELLYDQDISIMSSSILNNDFYVGGKKAYLLENEKLLKLEILENYKLKYKANIDVVGDYKYYCKRNQTNKRESQATYNVYEIIIKCIMDGKLIDKNRLHDLTEQDIALIDAINDSMFLNNQNIDNQETYSNLQKQITSLKDANDVLTNKNNKLKCELDTTMQELKGAKLENEKSLVLVKNITNALNDYNS